MPARLFARKSIEALQAEEHPLHRTLGGLQLMLLGIGCIVGAGVYVMTGTAAAHFAGPAVMLSFLLAATACGFTALCYAELASTIPVSGSSYTYAYATLGQVVAWGLSWLLMLEYGLAGSALAVGFSSYLVSLLTDFGVHIPAWLSTPSVVSTVVDGRTSFSLSGGVNLIAAIALLVSAVILSAGVSKSTLVTTILVFIKISALVAFVAVGSGAVNPANWTPFIPANEGGFAFGWQGIVRGASILFFAYLGFETVSTAASETKNPQRNMPIGILGALFVCTALYIAVAAVLTGLVPYKQLGVADPIAVAVDRIGQCAICRKQIRIRKRRRLVRHLVGIERGDRLAGNHGRSTPSASRLLTYPGQCSATISVNSRRAVGKSISILPSRRSIRRSAARSCRPLRPISIASICEGEADLMAA